jgi:Ni/Fe-hydrogenase 1 B-type cytochrome subunit
MDTSIIAPEKQSITAPGQAKSYSAPLRLWHWLNAIVLTGSLLTVLVNSTITGGKKNMPLVQQQLTKANVNAGDNLAKQIAHTISDKTWAIHTYFGYCLAGLLVFRLLLEFFQVADQKLILKIRTAYKDYMVIKRNRELARHELFVKTLYACFYLMLLIMASTGLCLAFEDNVPALKAIHAIRQIHGFTMYLILGFIALHLAGIYLAEHKDGKGIVSDMINGGGKTNA